MSADPTSRGLAGKFALARKRLIAEIEAEVRETSPRLGRDRLDPGVIAAMAKVPRHVFVPPDLEDRAYDNAPLPIGFGQTISQPFIVAVMTDLLAPRRGDIVLEIGTGCGYQAAVLAELVERVYTIELVPELAESAAERLARLGYTNVEVRAGDGAAGWPEHAPFDGIIVTAAAPRIPELLIGQLKPGRRMVVPVGEAGGPQDLLLVEPDPSGGGGPIAGQAMLPVAFVPLRRGRGG